MDTLTRRRFLAASGAATVAAGALALSWEQLAATAIPGAGRAAGSRTLVIVTLYGGNDGLNTVIPYADAAYHDARADLAYPAEQVLHLTDSLGLNPGMKGFASLYRAGRLAIVRGVGYPRPDHSHFRSMDIWQTASPDEPVPTGWIGRWLDATGDDPVRAVSVGSVLPPLAVGARATAAALPLGGARPLSAPQRADLTALGTADPADREAAAAVRASYRAERVADTALGKALDPTATSPSDPDSQDGGSAGGQNGLAEQLAAVSRCIRAGVPTKVYAVSLGGFDTHANEKATQQAQLSTVDSAVTEFLSSLAPGGRDQGVVVLIYSEFGRRVRANASLGTDHGTAGPVFLAGVPVVGGMYGTEPSLTDLDDGDLRASTDFRVVYGELLASVLGADPGQVLGADRPRLGVVSA